MTITAKIVADSITGQSLRITTLQLRYPRFIHSEFMTHRMFSRNASSSRAIPVSRLIQDVLDDTAMPVSWGKNQKGMQAGEEHDAPIYVGMPFMVPLDRERAWLLARDSAVMVAKAYAEAGYHKQVVNRVLEPFAHINVVVTSTEWDNFFALRDHTDADPTIQVLARAIRAEMKASTPRPVTRGEWHLPYVQLEEYGQPIEFLQRISAARCARVSYMTHDNRTPEFQADMRLAYDLINGGHYSPLEHQATPRPGWNANFCGWASFRRELGH